MTYVPLSYLPGVTKTVAPYASSKESSGIDNRPAYGRFIDMDGARFAGGYPEKIGGCSLYYSTALSGVPRGMRDWRDFNRNIYLGIGTNSKLYYISAGVRIDITPYRSASTGTLTNPFTTVNGSMNVSVAHTGHGQEANDYVQFTSSAAVGGITVSGVFHIASVTDANNYVITVPAAATSSVSGGGGSVAYVYYRLTLTNPFATVSGSPIVTVTQTSHGATVGDYVNISDASAVGGLTLAGDYVIGNTTANTYTITAASNATSTATGGGSPTLQYEIPAGLVSNGSANGYGTGGFGQNGFGTFGTNTVPLDARTWSLAKYGQQLLASPIGGTIYVWDPIIGGRAYPLYNAPPICRGMFVTPERFVVALGVYGNPMQLAWADQNDYTQWTSTPTNTANSGRTLQEGAFLVNGISTRNGINMVFSNTAAYGMNYSGDNNVYETPVAGKKCGLVGPLAVTEVGDVVYWMSDKDFWMWNGSVSKLPSDDIRDYVFDDINLSQSSKFVVTSLGSRTEIKFYYCSASSIENDKWVTWHGDDQQCWSKGTVMPRSCALDKELLDYPVACDTSGFVYNQEFGVDNMGAALDSYVQFCPFDISNGDQQMDIMGYIPDYARLVGNMSLTVVTQDYPQSTPNIDGPYTLAPDGSTAIVDLRSNGRLIGYKIESNVLGGDWRLGLPRVSAQPAGSRR